ncbi:MAG: SUMF1/EgtB/PvdO family nonheme iron enzyme [Planctomycetota bacterium]|nr:SUMF1/EgtB/PvdO family nonheme iron enzyme [Planctomycetota bacterium]
MSCFAGSCQTAPEKKTPTPNPVKKKNIDKKIETKTPKAEDKKAIDDKKKAADIAAKKAEELKREEVERKAQLKRDKVALSIAQKGVSTERDRWSKLSKLWKEKGDANVLERIKVADLKAKKLEKSKDYAGAAKESNRLRKLYQSLCSDLEAGVLKKLVAEKDSAKAAKAQFEGLVKQSSELPTKNDLEAKALQAYKSAQKVPETERRNSILAYQRAGEAYRRASTERSKLWAAWKKKKEAELASGKNAKAAQESYLKSAKELEAAKQAWLTETKRWGLKPNDAILKSGTEQTSNAKKLADDKKFKEALSLLEAVLTSYRDQRAAVVKETEARVMTARTEAETARETWRQLINKADKEFLKRPEEATKAELALSEGNEIQDTRPRKAFQKYKVSANLFGQSIKKHTLIYEAWVKAKSTPKTPVKVEPKKPAKVDPKPAPVKVDPKPAPVKDPIAKKEPMKEPKPETPKTKIKPDAKPDLTPPTEAGANVKPYTKMESWEDAKKVLSNRLLWNASRGVQDSAIEMVKEKLGAGFQFIETKEYKCNGQSHRIATFKHVKSGLLLNLIPGGKYQMGSNDGDLDEKPRHLVTIQPLLVGRHELRHSVWNRIATTKRAGPESNPVSNVSWNLSQEWLKSAGDGLRLPSESEWEYSCRSGTVSPYYWGNKLDDSHCWNAKNTRKMEKEEQSVEAHFKTEKWNAFGLVDVSGNVFEWCQDEWVNHYSSGPNDQTPLEDRGSSFRVIRGGTWLFGGYSCRSAFRGIERADQAFPLHGLRVFKSLPK